MIRAGKPSGLFVSLLAGAFLLLTAVLPSSAEIDAPGLNSEIAERKTAIEALVTDYNRIAGGILSNHDNDAALVEMRLRLEEIAKQLLEDAVMFRPRLLEIRRRQDQLGKPPAENEPAEPEAVAQERITLANEKAEINALIGQAENASVAVNKVLAQISDLRRDLFTRTLSKRYDISYAFGVEAKAAAWQGAERLVRTFSYWFRTVIRTKLQSALLVTFLSLLAAVIIFIGGKRFFGPIFHADPAIEEPSYISRLSVAFWSTMLPVLAVGVFLRLTHFLYHAYGVIWGGVSDILGQLSSVILVVFFINRLADKILSPALANWRLVPIADQAANTLVWLITLIALVTGADFLISEAAEVLGSPLQLTVAESLVASVIAGLLIIAVAMTRPNPDDETGARPWPRIIRYPLYLIGAATIIIAGLGYIGLARFIIQQMVISGGVAVTMYIGFLSAGAISSEGAFQDSALGRRIASNTDLSDTALDRIGILVSILIYIVVLAGGVPAILLQWGFQWGDIKAWVLGAMSEINVGSVSFSIGGILTGILVFVFGYFLTRWFKRWVDNTVLSRSRIDSGVRNSIRTTIGYAGIALAALVGVSAAGLDLSSLALIAGGLSLGIGFGLQNIVSNFVSGLILLAERPFKAGDWIVAGSVEGTVKRVNVRATEIETFQRQTVILPNSDLINQAVGNWTHRNKLGRLEIAVGVAYGSDVTRVREILTELALGHEMVIKNPEPAVIFMDFGASSLDFEIRMYLYDISNIIIVQNELRFAILAAFEEAGIEIPFPQHDINIKGDPAALSKTKPGAKSSQAKTAAERPERPAVRKPATQRSKRKLDPDE